MAIMIPSIHGQAEAPVLVEADQSLANNALNRHGVPLEISQPHRGWIGDKTNMS